MLALATIMLKAHGHPYNKKALSKYKNVALANLQNFYANSAGQSILSHGLCDKDDVK